jgi:hypothetical protein
VLEEASAIAIVWHEPCHLVAECLFLHCLTQSKKSSSDGISSRWQAKVHSINPLERLKR